jgi:Arc/MetJ-type ribon-helix-helix transcriptional regulator
MQILVENPDLGQFIRNQVECGHFRSATAVVEAALARMLLEDEPEDDRSPETLAAIQRGLADAEAGRTRPWSEFKKEWMRD